MVNRKKAVLQIFTGGYSEDAPSFEQVREVLEPMLLQMPVEKLIMGWSVKPEVYLKTIELAKHYGTEIFLWLPALSETGLLKPVRRLTDDEGKEVRSVQLKEGESFEFYCPNQPVNVRSFLEIYEEYFSGIPFDGIFLDKIRYGSFSNGKSGVFSCFCPECRKGYAKSGLRVKELEAEMKRVREGEVGYQRSPLGLLGYDRGKYRFENPVWERFFSYKCESIISFLESVTKSLRLRGLKIGMDTFSPFTAYFAGQDIVRMSEMADFVKPMMYRITRAPAGLSWESGLLLKETLTMPEKNDFFRMLGIGRGGDIPFDLEFVKRELAMLSDAGIMLYPGIEINRIAQTAETTPDYIRENVEALSRLPIDGFVLAWDLLSAPEENRKEVVRLFGENGEYE